MAQIHFTDNLHKHLDVPPAAVAATDLRMALEQVFTGNPRLRGYLLDDQGRLRQHVAIFVDNELILDRTGLSDRLLADSQVFVMQALSGG